jgi:PAS domain S-box-containing protein
LSPLTATLAVLSGLAAGAFAARSQQLQRQLAASRLLAAAAALFFVSLVSDQISAAPHDLWMTSVAGLIYLVFARLVAAAASSFVSGQPRRPWVSLKESWRLDGAALIIGAVVGAAADQTAGAALLGMIVIALLEFGLSRHIDVSAERQKLSSLVVATSDGILTVDRSNLIRSWNPAMERISGRSAGNTIGRPLGAALPPWSRDQPDLLRVAVSGLPVAFAARRAGGDCRELAITRAPLDGGGFVLIARDLTEQRQAERALAERDMQLLQAQKMESLGRLAGGFAHDFNNLLTTITGYARFLAKALDGDQRRRREVCEIERAAERGSEMIKQLLVFSPLQESVARPLDLNEAVRTFELALRSGAGDQVELKLQLAPELWPCELDPTQIERVLAHLVTNAGEAMPGGGICTITTANLDGEQMVRLSVADTGGGMDPATRERALEPFFTTKGLGQRAGIGLATVYVVISQAGGEVGIESEPGQGSVIHLSLPRGGRPAEPFDDLTAVRSNYAEEHLKGQESVLIADDDARIRQMIVKGLQEYGYTALEARDGREAIQISASYGGPIDVFVSDVLMPGMPGPDAVAAIRDQRPKIRIVMMSGYMEGALKANALAAGLFIEKPFSVDALAAKIREVRDGAAPERSKRA